jgi:hypothetical protein
MTKWLQWNSKREVLLRLRPVAARLLMSVWYSRIRLLLAASRQSC